MFTSKKNRSRLNSAIQGFLIISNRPDDKSESSDLITSRFALTTLKIHVSVHKS